MTSLDLSNGWIVDSSHFFWTFFHLFIIMVDGCQGRGSESYERKKNYVICLFFTFSLEQWYYFTAKVWLNFSVLICPPWMKNNGVKKRRVCVQRVTVLLIHIQGDEEVLRDGCHLLAFLSYRFTRVAPKNVVAPKQRTCQHLWRDIDLPCLSLDVKDKWEPIHLLVSLLSCVERKYISDIMMWRQGCWLPQVYW